MKYFTVFDEATGKILRSGLCGDEDLPAQAGFGEVVIEADSNPYSDYISHGLVCAMSAQPSPHHEFDYASKSWVLNLNLLVAAVKMDRDARLLSCDWTQLPDAPEAIKAAWATYRQALRDVPDQSGFPLSITWPAPPTAP